MVYDESLFFHPEPVEQPKKPKRDLKEFAYGSKYKFYQWSLSATIDNYLKLPSFWPTPFLHCPFAPKCRPFLGMRQLIVLWIFVRIFLFVRLNPALILSDLIAWFIKSHSFDILLQESSLFLFLFFCCLTPFASLFLPLYWALHELKLLHLLFNTSISLLYSFLPKLFNSHPSFEADLSCRKKVSLSFSHSLFFKLLHYNAKKRKRAVEAWIFASFSKVASSMSWASRGSGW